MIETRTLHKEGFKVRRENGALIIEGNGYLDLKEARQLKEFVIEEVEQMKIEYDIEQKKKRKPLWKRIQFWKLQEKK